MGHLVQWADELLWFGRVGFAVDEVASHAVKGVEVAFGGDGDGLIHPDGATDRGHELGEEKPFEACRMARGVGAEAGAGGHREDRDAVAEPAGHRGGPPGCEDLGRRVVARRIELLGLRTLDEVDHGVVKIVAELLGSIGGEVVELHVHHRRKVVVRPLRSRDDYTSLVVKNTGVEQAEGQHVMTDDRRSKGDLEPIRGLVHGVAGDHPRIQQEAVDDGAPPFELIARHAGRFDAGHVDFQGFEGIAAHSLGERVSCGFGLFQGAAGQDDPAIAGLGKLCGRLKAEA